MRQFFILVISLLCIHSCFSQHTLLGKVQSEELENIAGAIVQLFQNDSITFLQFTRTDTIGEWSMKGIKSGKYVLKIAVFGSEPCIEVVDLTTDQAYPINTVLYHNLQQIKVVQINAKLVGFVLHGDTTIYKLDAYTDSTEYDLKDILNKLPGISADEGGIKYNGRRVNVVLTEGKDIFGQLHKQMMESIKAEDVAGVQIIERYKEGIDYMNQPDQDKVALNVKLTDEAKNRINGDAGANTDITSHYELNGTAYKTGGNTGFTTLLRGNNTAQPIVAGADLLALLDFDDLKNINDQKLNSVLSLFTPAIGARQNNDQFVFARIITNPNPFIKSKAAITLANFYRQVESVSFGVYTNENNIFTGLKRKKNPSRFLNIDLQNAFHKNNYQLDIKTPFTISMANPEQLLIGLLDSIDLQNTYLDQHKSIAFAPAVSFGYQMDSSQSFILESKYNISINDKVLNIQSAFPVFGLPDTTLSQFADNESYGSELSLTYQAEMKQHKANFTVGLEHNRLQLNLTTYPTPAMEWLNTTRVADQSLYAVGSIYRNHLRRFRYNLTAKVERFQRSFEKKTSHQRFYNFLSGNGGLYYDFNKFHNLYLSAKLNVEAPHIVNLFRVRQIQDANILKIENVDSNYLYKQLTFNLFYANKDPLAVFDYNIQMNYSIQGNTVLYQTFAEQDYFINYSYLSPSVNIFTLDATGTYRIKKWKASLSPSASLERTKGYTAVGSVLYATQIHNLSSSIFANYPVFTGLMMTAGFKINYRQQNIEYSDAEQIFLDKVVNIGFQFKRNKWFAKTNVAYQDQYFSGLNNKIWVWDAEVEYRIANIPLRLRLIGRNILNLKGNQVIMPDFTFNYIGVDQFTTNGGQVMIGAVYVF